MLFVSSLDKGLVVSSDYGATWSVLDTAKYYTGFAFTSGSRGIVATMGSLANGFPPTNYWLYTTDGGQNWKPTHMYFESWQPIGIPTTETYFAATAYSIGGSSIMRSDNDGYSFISIPSYTQGATDVLNEAMQGDGCSLFAASTQSVGMWVSVDDGQIWQGMVLPPNPTPGLYTRFYVSPTTVWSFQGKALQWVARTATANIHLWPNFVNFTNAGCKVPTDTIIHIFGCNCQNNDTLKGDSTFETQNSDSLTALGGTFPRPLCAPGTSPLGTPDSIHVHYEPKDASLDTGGVIVKFSENGVPYYDTVIVTGNSAKSSLSVPPVTHTIALFSGASSYPNCRDDEVDTCITITNTGCTPITIQSTNITPAQQPCILWSDALTNVVLDPEINPSQTFCVHFRPSLQAGQQSLAVSFTWSSDGGITSNTTNNIHFAGITTTTIQPSFRGFHIGFDRTHPLNCCYGEIPSDTTIYFINSTCDTLTLSQPNIFGSTDPNVFKFNNAKPPIVFPVTIPPGQFIPLGVHINCHQGVDSEKVQFTYSVGVSGGDCSSFLIASDTAVLAFKSSGGITVPTFKPSSITFNGVSCCDSSQIRTLTIKTGCVYDTLTAMKFDSAGGTFYLVQPVTVPQTDHPDSSFTIQFGYLPSTSAKTGSIKLTFSDGTILTVPITSQACSNVAEAALSMDQINFDTLLSCGAATCDTVWIKNASCGAIKIGAIVPPGPANPAFTVTPPAAGTSLIRGDSVAMLICLDPTKDTLYGNITDNAVLAIDDANGNPASFDTLTLLAYVTPPIPADSITQLASTTICDTDTLDESFTFFNIGQCYTYVITGASSPDGAKVTVTPVDATYPVRVGVGDKQIFQVHFDPQNVARNLTGTITLTDSAGNNITVPYNITVDSCNIAGHFTLTMPGDTITTPNCTTGKLVFTAGAGGGSGTVTGVTVAGSTRFAATTPTSGSMPFTDTITFDPNLTGGNTATLTISYTINGVPEPDTTITLTGVVTGSKFKATVNVVSESVGAVKPNNTMMKDFEVVLEDQVFDSLDMNKLSLLIRFDGDLLWQPIYVFDAGWAKDPATYQDKQGLHLVLDYVPSGKQYTGGNDTIVKVKFLAAVSDSNATVAYADSAHFNDSTFEACTLKALNGSGTAPFSIDTSCSTAMLERALPLNLQPYSGIQVVPNPAYKDGSAATLHFKMNVDAPVTTDIVNVLGTPVAQLSNGPLAKGDHALAIPTNNMAEGAYFVRITSNGYTVVRKFVLEKE